MADFYKVGDTVWAQGKIEQVDEDDPRLPYRVQLTNGVGRVWTGGTVVAADPTAASPDYCLGFADGYDYATEDNTSLPVFGAVTADYRRGWRGGYVHGRAEQDAANLAIVDGGE